MKICQSCGNLVSDTEARCQKCGAQAEITYMNQNAQQVQQIPQTQPVQQVQQMQPVQQMPQAQPVQQAQPLMQFTQTQPTPKKNNKFADMMKKNYKPISIAIILILVAVCTYLVIDNISLRKKVKLNATSAVEPSYKIEDNTNNSKDVIIEAEDEEYNFEIPEGTYPKVSQKYVFFVDEAYTATVIEQSGGLSLLNTTTGATGWVAVNRTTLSNYRDKKESLKSSYESQGITVTNMYDQTFYGKDALVLEMIKGDQPMLLIISDAATNECYILTITNANIKTGQDTTTANDLMKMLSISEKL